MKIAVFSSKNEDFFAFEAVYGPKDASNVFKNIIDVFSNLKLTCSEQGMYWNALVLMIVVIVKKSTLRWILPFFGEYIF